MNPIAESSDITLLDLLRRVDVMSVADMARAMGVTATAVRQRLNRLMAEGLVERKVVRSAEAARGRPSHGYSLTEKGRQQTGVNFADLAIALWKEIGAISDPQVRRGLMGRLAKTLAGMYGDKVVGETTAERMQSVKRVFEEKNIPFTVNVDGQLPVLVAEACPYPQLAEQDRSVCSMEKMLFSELLNTKVSLTECRLDGATCCTFQTQ